MVRTRGPHLSHQASGTLAQTVTASTWRGRSYLKLHTPPTLPFSKDALASRAVLTALTQAWPLLTTAQRATWSELALNRHTTPLALLTEYNLNWWNASRPLSIMPDYGSAPLTLALTSRNTTARQRTVHHDATATGPSNLTFFLLYRHTTSTALTASNNLIYAVLISAPCTITHVDTPPSPGTWRYRWRRASPLGAFSTNYPIEPATIPA